MSNNNFFIPFIKIYNIYIYIYIHIYVYIYMLYILCICIYIYLYIYGIHHRKILWSSYRKLAWVGFEPTTTEFRSDTITDWAISHEFNSHSEPTLYSYSNFIVCSVSHFISAIAFVSRHVCFNRSFVEVITWV